MNKKTLIILIVVLLAFGIAVGFFFGMKNGKESADENLQKVVGLIFPKPPEEIFSMTGTLKAVNGTTLSLEVRKPDDYLPHVDGSAPATETRYVSVLGTTKITLIDITKIDAKGNPETTELKINDLKIGGALTVRSDKNIKDEKSFDANQIEVVNY